MCVAAIVAVTSAALSIAGSMAQYSAASQAAKDQNEYYLANAKASQQAAVNEYAALQNKQVQEKVASSQQLFQQNVEALQARSSAAAAAGDAGVSGLSVDALVGDYFAQQGRRAEALDTQYQMTAGNIRAEMEQTEAKAQSRINSVQRANPPSIVPFLISGASGAVNAFSKMIPPPGRAS